VRGALTREHPTHCVHQLVYVLISAARILEAVPDVSSTRPSAALVTWARSETTETPSKLGPRLALVEILRACDFGRRPSVRKGRDKGRPKTGSEPRPAESPAYQGFRSGPA